MWQVHIVHALNTVESYIDALCETFLVYKTLRYDVKGREILKTGYKYYIADLGLRWHLLGNRVEDEGHILENIVYLELRRRSQNVFVGKVGMREVDFITRDGDDIRYYQVAASVRHQETREREYAALDAIKDHYPKMLITLDEAPPATSNGIRQVSAIDFLLDRQ